VTRACTMGIVAEQCFAFTPPVCRPPPPSPPANLLLNIALHTAQTVPDNLQTNQATSRQRTRSNSCNSKFQRQNFYFADHSVSRMRREVLSGRCHDCSLSIAANGRWPPPPDFASLVVFVKLPVTIIAGKLPVRKVTGNLSVSYR